MLKKILLGLLLVLLAFVAYVASRPGKFRYERSGLIQAEPARIYPYLSELSRGSEWSPYERLDPAMKKSIRGAEGSVGAALDFESDSAGAGNLEVLRLVPNEAVDLRLTMLKPIHGENLIEYRLAPEAGGTRFTLIMSGEGGFVSKLMSVLIDCDKMIGGQFEEGIANLKQVVEKEG